MDKFDEKFKKIQKKKILKAAVVEKLKIEDFLKNHSAILLNTPKIPNILQPTKIYENFSFKIVESEKENGQMAGNDNLIDQVIILLNSEKLIHENLALNVIEVEFDLFLSFYSHSELIKMLTPINLKFSAYEIIGDIIHLNLSDQQVEYKQLIADIIYYKTGKTVINKIGKINETFRFYNSEVLAGPNKLTTIHKENDVKIFLDLGTVYWCSRLQTERIRILKMIKKGQVICDPFCGAGPHVIPAIKKGASALCNDLNPSAIECLKKSLKLNKIDCKVIENMDAGLFLEKMHEVHVDHFIFNLPEFSLQYIKHAEQYPPNFYLHVFFFCRSELNVVDYVKEMTQYSVKDEWIREVRQVSPSKSVFKLEVTDKDFFAFQKAI
jgi:tRNA (guanine37-N1)-methyltransferase